MLFVSAFSSAVACEPGTRAVSSPLCTAQPCGPTGPRLLRRYLTPPLSASPSVPALRPDRGIRAPKISGGGVPQFCSRDRATLLSSSLYPWPTRRIPEEDLPALAARLERAEAGETIYLMLPEVDAQEVLSREGRG
jgi:hypothetical protein